MLDVRVVADPDEFFCLAQPLLASQPAEHTTIASILRDVRTGARLYPDAMWIVAVADGNVAGLAMWTAPWPPYLGPMLAAAASAVADLLADRTGVVPGLNGEAAAVRTAIRRYQEHHPGVRVAKTTGVRLHRLEGLVRPEVAGCVRAATWDDHDLVEPWYRDFAVDVGHDPIGVMESMRIHLDRSTLLLWEVDGRAVAMAGRTPSAAGVARVGPVYTPLAYRRHGYGAAVTAEASARAQAPDVKAVVLFTDMANPTSNKIYAEIGFRPVRDYLEVSFGQGS